MKRPAFILLSLGTILAAAGCKKGDTPAAPVAPVTAPAPVAPTPPPAPAAAAAPAGVQERVEIAVTEQGFVPAKIPAKAGKPVTLAITRKVERTCATEIVFQGQEGKTDLPLGKTVEVTYTPKSSGNINFGCAMGMMIGGVLEVGD